MPNRILEQPRAACGFVYFIETEDRAYVKIGFSMDVRKRLATLQIAYPCVFRLLGWMPGDLKTEKRLHHTLAQHRHNGEWFRNNKDVRAAIESFTLHREPLDQLPVRGAERHDSAAQGELRLPGFDAIPQFIAGRAQLRLPGFEHLPQRITGFGGKRIRLLNANYTGVRAYFRSLMRDHKARLRNDPKVKEAKALMEQLRKRARTDRRFTVRELFLD
jgi:hypothetical protein